MRKILLFISLLPMLSFSQEVSTSVEEYNFLTKGIKELRKNGLDQKKDGFTLEVFFETIPNFKSKVRQSYKFRLLKDSKNELKAIGVEMLFSPTSSNYYCIPINNSELMKMYIKQVDDLMPSTQQELLSAVSEALMFLASKK